MKTNINVVLDKHQKKTNKNFSLPGKIVSVTGPIAQVESGGRMYSAIMTRTVARPGDNCTIERNPGNRMWRISEVYNDPVRGSSMSRQDMFGNGEVLSTAVATSYPAAITPHSTPGEWVDLSDALFITIARTRLLAHATADIRSTATSGRVDYKFRFAVDDETYFSAESGSYFMHTFSSGNWNQNVTFESPILNLPPGLREVTVQVQASVNGSGAGNVRLTSFYLLEI